MERSYRGRILKHLETMKTLKVIQSPSTKGCVDIFRTTHILAAAARVRRRLLVTHTLLPSASEVEIIIVSPSSHPFLTLRMLPFSLHPLSRSFETTAAPTPCPPISLSQPWTLPLHSRCERKVSYVAISFGLNELEQHSLQRFLLHGSRSNIQNQQNRISATATYIADPIWRLLRIR